MEATVGSRKKTTSPRTFGETQASTLAAAQAPRSIGVLKSRGSILNLPFDGLFSVGSYDPNIFLTPLQFLFSAISKMNGTAVVHFDFASSNSFLEKSVSFLP
jgi:hypothetical protein